MLYIKKIFLSVMFIFSVISCSTTPPSSYYILVSSKAKMTQEKSLSHLRVGVGPVRLPGRLDRSQIVTRLGTHAIKIHEFQRWGDSLQRQFEERLADNLASLLQTPYITLYPWERALRPQYQILINISQFEGLVNVGTKADIIWQIIDVKTDQLKLTRNFIIQTKSSSNTMTSYIESQSKALDALSKDIAQGLYEITYSK